MDDHVLDRLFPDDSELARRMRAFDGSAWSLAPRWPTGREPGAPSAAGPAPSSPDMSLGRWRALIEEAFLQAERTRRLIEAGRATSEHCDETVTSSIRRLRHSRDLLATVASHADLVAIVRRRGELTRMPGPSRVRA